MINYQAHKISDNLYQGGVPPSGKALRKAGIDVLVLCAREWQDPTGKAHPGVTVIRCGGDDSLDPDVLADCLPAWQRAAQQVVDAVIAGKKVLVTCMAGHNRSGIVTAMALAQLTRLSGQEIVDHIQRSRPMALNNETFVDHINRTYP